MSKALFHSELSKLGPIEVEVKTDVMTSKFKGKNDYVVLVIDGEERNYNVENDACAAAFDGLKGMKVVLEATGGREEAEITISAKSAHRGQQKPVPRQPDRQQADPTPEPPTDPEPPRPPAKPGHAPVYGATVGMAIKEACVVANNRGLNATTPEYFKFVHEFASDLVRVSLLIEAGKLAPSAKQRATEAKP